MTSVLALALLLAGPTPAKGVQWEKNFDQAMELAAKHDMPVMVDFWADWCGWCHRLDRTTYVDPVVGAKAKTASDTRSTHCRRSSSSPPAGGRC